MMFQIENSKTLHVESGCKIGILKCFRFNFLLNKTLDKSKPFSCPLEIYVLSLWLNLKSFWLNASLSEAFTLEM